MKVKCYKDLIVWQKSMALAVEVYRMTQSFPKDELYALVNQLRRAVVSVPSNIAEGQARHSTAEFNRYLSIAQGSIAEVETQILLAIRFNYLTEPKATPALNLCGEVSKMLVSLRSKLGGGEEVASG